MTAALPLPYYIATPVERMLCRPSERDSARHDNPAGPQHKTSAWTNFGKNVRAGDTHAGCTLSH